MNQKCPVCQTECKEDSTTCSFCKFTYEHGINFQSVSQEDLDDFRNAVFVYQDKWKAEKKAEAEAAALRQAQTAADEEAKRRADEEAKRRADEEARRRADEEARRRADEEARRRADEEAYARQRAENARLKAEADAAISKAEAEAAISKAEAEAAISRAEAEAARIRANAEAAARQRAEAEAQAQRARQQSQSYSQSSYKPTQTYSYSYDEDQRGKFLSVVFGLVCGFGTAFAMDWILSKITGIYPINGLLMLGILFAGIITTYAAWRNRKNKLFLILLFLSILGWLNIFDVIPGRPSRPSRTQKEIVKSSSAQTQNAEISVGCNFRKDPSMGENIIRQLKVGDRVMLTGEKSGNWVKITHNGNTGWVSVECVKPDSK